MGAVAIIAFVLARVAVWCDAAPAAPAQRLCTAFMQLSMAGLVLLLRHWVCARSCIQTGQHRYGLSP